MSTKTAGLEEKVLEIIQTTGEKGITQNELAKKLRITSKDCTRIVLRLVKRGMIRRELTRVNNKRVYVLYPATMKRIDINVNLDGLLDIPCFTCPHIEKCDTGNFYNPLSCSALTRWLTSLAKSNGDSG